MLHTHKIINDNLKFKLENTRSYGRKVLKSCVPIKGTSKIMEIVKTPWEKTFETTVDLENGVFYKFDGETWISYKLPDIYIHS